MIFCVDTFRRDTEAYEFILNDASLSSHLFRKQYFDSYLNINTFAILSTMVAMLFKMFKNLLQV